MRHFLIGAICLVASVNSTTAQWTKLPSPTTENLNAVSFFNARLGYAVGAKGTVIRTKDGGDTWSSVSSPDTSNLTSVVILDSSVLLVTTSNPSGNSAVYKSINSGTTWHKVLHDDLGFYATQTPDGRLFCISTYIYSSTDEGETWKPEKRLNSTSIYSHIEFADDQTGYVAGNIRGQYTYTPEFLRSVDGGNKWHPSYSFGYPDTSGYTSMSAMNADTIFMFTNYFKRFNPKKNTELLLITRFHLKGSTDTVWNFKAKIQIQQLQDVINTCKFFEGGTGFAAGEVGIIYHTTSYGRRWNKEYTGKTTIHGIYMQNLNKGFAVGDAGLILRREDTTVPSMVIAPPAAKPLHVYPNPAENSATLSFKLDKSADLIVQVTNENGVIVYTKQLKQYSAGEYQLIIPVANLQRGVYHIALFANSELAGKSKLLVVH